MNIVSTPIASSPLSGRHSNGPGFKRTVSGAARGAATASVPISLSSKNQLGGDGEATLFWMSSSLNKRSSVCSSPHTTDSQQRGSAAPPVQRVSPQVQQVGFCVPEQAPAPGSIPVLDAREASFTARSGVSLLSKALAPLQAPLTRTTSSSSEADYFPEVDTSLLHDLQERHAVFSSPLVVTAYMLSARIHSGQRRKDGTSQLSHCVMTALQLAELGLGEETVCAGLLHEVLRTNPLSRCHMEEFMPSNIVQLVDRVTTISEISQLYRNNMDTLNEEKMRRMLLAMEDVNAVLIKLACRVHNMKTIGALPADKQRLFAQETLDVFSVVANRLGMWSLKAELEDLAFSVLHPEEYEALKTQVATRQDPEALESTINTIKASLDERGVQYEDISGRPKNLFGIWCKMKKSKLTSIETVYDLTALRVVVTNKHDCYVALRCIQDVYRCMPGRSKDFIKDIRKPNGYQSLHETILGAGGMPVEVQIRTHKMHYIAEYGFAAHWKYKEKLSNEDEWLDKEVQYKKWLTTYKLGIHDKKVRASGAPPRETALNSLGMHLIDGRGGSDPRVDPFLRHDRFRLQAPLRQNVSVVVQTQDSIDSRELPRGYPASQLARELHLGQLPGYVMTVNRRVPGQECILQDGDLIQVVLEKDVSPAASPPVSSPMQSRMANTPKQQRPSPLYQPQGTLFTRGSVPTTPEGISSQRPPLPGRSLQPRHSADYTTRERQIVSRTAAIPLCTA